MKVIPFRIFTAIALFGVVLFSCKEAPKTEAPAKKPNVVFIFADDHSYNALSNLGADEVYTPNLDRLRKNGTDFSHTYNMGGWNGAICVASRAMINTGQYIWNARRTDSLVRKGQPTNPYWSEYMQQAGYDTYMTGKWHVSRKAEEIFNTVGHVRGGMPRSVKTAYNRPLSVNDTVWKSTDTINGGFWAGGTHWSEVVANDALQFIDSA
jgi:choline-sulfatase